MALFCSERMNQLITVLNQRYDYIIFDSPALTLPHPRARQRLFVLEPLAEIAPEMRFPDTGESVAEALARLRTEAEA